MSFGYDTTIACGKSSRKRSGGGSSFKVSTSALFWFRKYLIQLPYMLMGEYSIKR